MILKNDPVFACTVFSVVLHLGLVLVLLKLPAMPLPSGNGLRIELLRSLAAPGQSDAAITEQDVQQPVVAEQARAETDALLTQSVVDDPVPSLVQVQPRQAPRRAATSGGDRAEGADTQTTALDAETRTAAMLELLHDEISDHKRYPYLARRQRREGTARVEFMLHPDGRIDNTALLESSRSRALDHAALTAIEEISPFEPATHYLSQAQSFRIDVVFRLQ